MIQKLILQYLAANPGSKAKDIAAVLKYEKSEVNQILYSLKSLGKAKISTEFEWSLSIKPPKSEPQKQMGLPPAPLAVAETINSQKVWTECKPTSEQEPVVCASPSMRLIVEAGPGTGKTETLVNRLKFLVREGCLPPSSIVVLSFSVAAVKELKTRLERRESGAEAYVEIRTFDSFASRLIRPLVGENALWSLDYDERIACATQQLLKETEPLGSLREFRHVLLDEVQDLVGVRADFAVALLSYLKPGFTLFGDSAQGIYDFHIKSGPSTTTSADMLEKIRELFPDTCIPIRLTKNFRVGDNSALAGIATTGRTLLLSSPKKAKEYLEQEFAKLTSQGSTSSPQISAELCNRSTCVVCRTNGQVLQLGAELQRVGVQFRMARERNEFVAPSWIGRLFFRCSEQRVRREVFVADAGSLLGIGAEAANGLWEGTLSAVGRRKGSFLEITELRAALTEGAVLPDPWAHTVSPDVLELTTIHRSKGREFSNVIVVMDSASDSVDGNGEDAAHDSVEPRVLFVALTRARDSLSRMNANLGGERLTGERWIRSYRIGKGFNTLSGIEVGMPKDVDAESFVAGDPGKAAERQTTLLNLAHPGALAVLKHDGREAGCPKYNILIGGQLVGRMSADFGWAVWHTLKYLNKGKPKSFPETIENVRIRNIMTAVGSLASGEVDRSLLTSGLWLVPTLEGMGQCKWN